jgi:hypothetical protein
LLQNFFNQNNLRKAFLKPDLGNYINFHKKVVLHTLPWRRPPHLSVRLNAHGEARRPFGRAGVHEKIATTTKNIRMRKFNTIKKKSPQGNTRQGWWGLFTK